MKKIISLSLVIFGICSSVLLAEIVLRFTPTAFLLGPTETELQQILERGSFKEDAEAGYDLGIDNPPSTKRLWFDRQEYQVWTNELGCFDMPLSPADQEAKYGILLGDSFAYGSNDFRVSFGSVLQDSLATRIARCGVGGYGPEQTHKKFLKILKQLQKKPDFLIFLYFVGNDMFDDFISPAMVVEDQYLVPRIDYAKSDFSTGSFKAYTDDEKRAKTAEVLHQVRRMERFPSILGVLLQSRLYRKPANPYQTVPTHTASSHSPSLLKFDGQTFPWLQKAWDHHKNILRRFFTDIRNAGIPFAVVAVPTNEQVYPFLMTEAEKHMNDLELPDRILTDFFTAESIPHLFLRSSFEAIADVSPRSKLDPRQDLYKTFDGHFSELGDEFAALLSARFLSRQNLVQVSPQKEKETAERITLIEKRKISKTFLSLILLASGPPLSSQPGSCQILESGSCGVWMKVEGLSPAVGVFHKGIKLPSVINLHEKIITTEIPKSELTGAEIVIELRDEQEKQRMLQVKF